MKKPRLMMRVRRGLDYTSISGLVYRATIRVYLRISSTTSKDISLIHVRSKDRIGLEKKIRSVQKEFDTLIREDPDFVKRIAEPEIIYLDEDQ